MCVYEILLTCIIIIKCFGNHHFKLKHLMRVVPMVPNRMIQITRTLTFENSGFALKHGGGFRYVFREEYTEKCRAVRLRLWNRR